MNIEFRKVTLDDVVELVNVRIEFISEVNLLTNDDKIVLREANNKYFMESIKNGSYVSFIALFEGKIAGTSGITFYNVPPNKKCPNGKVGYISNMFTLKEYRGMGIASKLFSLVINEAKDMGCGKILLNATDMGRPLYEKFGFTATKGDMEYIIKNT
jgi:GNAT superfamily N-acetyltransferase